MPKEQNQRGFGALGIFTILLVVAVVAFAAWFVWSKNHSTKDALSNETTSDSKPVPTKEISWQTYKHDKGGFTFQYPDSWTNRAETIDPLEVGQGQDFAGVNGEITAPSGRIVEWHYQLIGGKGGDCEPDEDDVVFAAGNRCGSKQIMYAEALPIVTPTSPIAKRLFDNGLYITKTKYRPLGNGGDVSYNLCLDAHSSDFIPRAHEPLMGLVFECGFWDTGLNMTYSVKSEADLSSDEAKIVEQIMRSVKPL